MLIIRRRCRVAPWLAIDPHTGSVAFTPLLHCLHERGSLRLKAFDAVEQAEDFIGKHPTICVGRLEICGAHFLRDGMFRISVVKSLPR